MRYGSMLALVAPLLLGASQGAAEEEGLPVSPWDVTPLLAGSTIPKATLETADGEAFDLNVAVAEKRTILVFYRGGW